MVDWVLKAYEADPDLPHPALVLLGPFMQTEQQADFIARAENLPHVEIITFDAHPEALIANAAGVVAMGGYNTFCEILSFDKPALIIPRTEPRREQFIRAKRAEELGLVRMLDPLAPHDPTAMATALRTLPQQNKPSSVVVPGLLDGLKNVNLLAHRLINRPRPSVRLAEKRAASASD